MAEGPTSKTDIINLKTHETLSSTQKTVNSFSRYAIVDANARDASAYADDRGYSPLQGIQFSKNFEDVDEGI